MSTRFFSNIVIALVGVVVVVAGQAFSSGAAGRLTFGVSLVCSPSPAPRSSPGWSHQHRRARRHRSWSVSTGSEELVNDTASAHDGRRWLVLAIVCVAFFMTILDVSIVNVALPSI